MRTLSSQSRRRALRIACGLGGLDLGRLSARRPPSFLTSDGKRVGGRRQRSSNSDHRVGQVPHPGPSNSCSRCSPFPRPGERACLAARGAVARRKGQARQARSRRELAGSDASAGTTARPRPSCCRGRPRWDGWHAFDNFAASKPGGTRPALVWPAAQRRVDGRARSRRRRQHEQPSAPQSEVSLRAGQQPTGQTSPRCPPADYISFCVRVSLELSMR